MPEGLRDRLLAELDSIRTVDCHSHTCVSTGYADAAPLDLFRLMSYFAREIEGVLGVAPDQAYSDTKSDAEKWEVLKGVVERCRNESYWRHNVVTYQQLFDLKDSELNDDNWEAVNDRIKERTADPDWYRQVTHDVCNLETQMRNVPWFEDWEPEYFTAILRMESALDLHNGETRKGLEQHLDREFGSLSQLKEGLAALVEEYRARGSRGIKLAHAYGRTLASEDVPEDIATALFARVLVGQALAPAEVKQLQDHIIFFLARLAGELGQVFDIHTGVQSNWGNIPNSDPLHLIPLLQANKQTRFSLYHAGYPYSREIGMLGKHYPNVWLNMAWMYVITMEGSRQSLNEWVDLVPGSRILGFGSDVGWPEMICSHLVMARSCIADVLATKVERDFLSEECALDLCHKLMRDNGMELYELEARG